MRRRAFIPIVAGAIAFLTAAGGGAAYAVLSAQANATITASPAQIGITTVSTTSGGAAGTLAYTYDDALTDYATASAIQITNTGTAAAQIQLGFAAQSSTVTTLPPAITVTVGVIGATTACLPSTSTTRTKSSTLVAPWTYGPTDTAPAPGFLLAKGAVLTLCIKTAIDTTAIKNLGATSYTLQVTPALKYANGAAWTATSGSIQAQQTVASDLLFFKDASGRYMFYQWDPDMSAAATDDDCVAPYAASSQHLAGVTNYATVYPGCNDWQRQWRMLPVGDGYPDQWYLSNAIDDVPAHQPAEPRWTDNGSGQPISVVAQNNALPQNASQRWSIQGRGDGTYQIVNVADGLCATRMTGATGGADNWTYPSDPRRLIDLEPCQGASNQWQGFIFDQIATPIPSAPLAATCGGSLPWSLDFAWPINSQYPGSSVYQIWIDGFLVLTTGPNSGYDPHWRPGNTDPDLASYVAQHGTGGSAGLAVTVKQSISSGAWTDYAVGKFYFAQIPGQAPGVNGFSCTAP